MMNKKAEHAFRLIDSVYLFRNEQVTDHAKRCVLRMLFVQIDNLLAIVPQIKNRLPNRSFEEKQIRKAIEEGLIRLKHSYHNSFDLIRDRLAAHSQPIELTSLFAWWSALDYAVVEILYGDVKEIQSSLEAADLRFLPIPDYQSLRVPKSSKLAPLASPVISLDRLAFSRQNTAYSIPLHQSQEKVQIILSIIEFLDVDFALMCLVNNPSTTYSSSLFEVAWMLAAMDLCSLVDNLFEDTEYDKSLLEYWKGDMDGYASLVALNASRDIALEIKIREFRNKYAAHIDQKIPLHESKSLFENADLTRIHEYAHQVVNGFRETCRKDIRTGTFLIHNAKLCNVSDANNKGAPFEDQ